MYLHVCRQPKKRSCLHNEELKNRKACYSSATDGSLFLKKGLSYACFHCFSLLIVLLEMMLYCVFLAVYYVFLQLLIICTALAFFFSFFILYWLIYVSLDNVCCLILCTMYCLTWLLLILYARQTSAFYYHTASCVLFILFVSAWCCLMLPDSELLIIICSALCTMWLSAPVLVYVPVDFCHWLCAPPQLLNACMVMWHCIGWLICGNHCPCSHGLVRLLLSSSDGFCSVRKMIIKKCACRQAASKPHYGK